MIPSCPGYDQMANKLFMEPQNCFVVRMYGEEPGGGTFSDFQPVPGASEEEIIITLLRPAADH